MLDAGLMAAAIGIDRRAAMADGRILGQLLETFVIAELRAELAVCRDEPRLFHLRDDGGRHEIDVIAEFVGGAVIALEIKAKSSPDRDDAKHLRWLRKRLGDELVAAAVLHTGPMRYSLGDGIEAIPISEIWA
jgi:uncharacterized protein